MNITDPQDEVFPSVDRNDNVIGKVTRKEANSNPKIIHRAITVLVFDKNNKLLIHKRSATKDIAPNAWTTSVGGHVDYGETYDSAALREVYEEIGIRVSLDRLKLLGKTLIQMPWENELTQVYEFHSDNELLVKPNPEEVAEVKFVGIPDVKRMLLDKTISWSEFARKVLNEFLKY